MSQPTTLRPAQPATGGLNTRIIVIGSLVVLVIGGVALTQFSLPHQEETAGQQDIIMPATDIDLDRELTADYSHMAQTAEPDPVADTPDIRIQSEPIPPPPMPPQPSCLKPQMVYGAQQLAAAPEDWAAYKYCVAQQAYDRQMYAYNAEHGTGDQQEGGQIMAQPGGRATSSATASSGGGSSGGASITPASSSSGGGGGVSAEPRDRHEDFRNRAASNNTLYHESSPEDLPVDACVVPAGSYIPAATIQDINMSLPGEASVMVTRDVLDITSEQVAIPAGSKITVSYDHQITRGQQRAQMAGAILTMPDYRTVSLGGASSYDATGAAGIEIDVNNHFMRRLGVATLGSLIDAIPAVAGQKVGVQISTGVSDVTSIGKMLVEEELLLPPTVEPTPAGTEIMIGVSSHLVMEECYGG